MGLYELGTERNTALWFPYHINRDLWGRADRLWFCCFRTESLQQYRLHCTVDRVEVNIQQCQSLQLAEWWRDGTREPISNHKSGRQERRKKDTPQVVCKTKDENGRCSSNCQHKKPIGASTSISSSCTLATWFSTERDRNLKDINESKNMHEASNTLGHSHRESWTMTSMAHRCCNFLKEKIWLGTEPCNWFLAIDLCTKGGLTARQKPT